jgi:uncharacterized protein YkwD
MLLPTLLLILLQQSHGIPVGDSKHQENVPSQANPKIPELVKHALNQVNKIRRSHNLAPLCLNESLQKSAEEQSRWMVSSGRFEHASDQEFVNRIERHQYKNYNKVSENIATHTVGKGQSGCFGHKSKVLAAINPTKSAEYVTLCQWYFSKGHLKNMLDPNVNQVGIAMVEGKYRGLPAYYWTQNFGNSPNPCWRSPKQVKPILKAPQKPKIRTASLRSKREAQPFDGMKSTFQQSFRPSHMFSRIAKTEESDDTAESMPQVTRLHSPSHALNSIRGASKAVAHADQSSQPPESETRDQETIPQEPTSELKSADEGADTIGSASESDGKNEGEGQQGETSPQDPMSSSESDSLASQPLPSDLSSETSTLSQQHQPGTESAPHVAHPRKKCRRRPAAPKSEPFSSPHVPRESETNLTPEPKSNPSQSPASDSQTSPPQNVPNVNDAASSSLPVDEDQMNNLLSHHNPFDSNPLSNA